MKLRNKKTGGLANLETIYINTDAGFTRYNKLSELTEDWEDYEPKEPIIKNEKFRKVVRAWADAIETDKAYLHIEHTEGSAFCAYRLSANCHFIQIAFHNKKPTEVEGGYTITELCGEDNA